VENIDLNKITIREVMEYTRDIPIIDGGLALILEKIVMEIEKLQEKTDESKHS